MHNDEHLTSFPFFQFIDVIVTSSRVCFVPLLLRLSYTGFFFFDFQIVYERIFIRNRNFRFLFEKRKAFEMNHSADDPDELVRRDIDLNHITNMSKCLFD